MPRPLPGALSDLLTATEAVGEDQRLRTGRPQSWKEGLFGARLRDLEVLACEAERSGHAATSLNDLRVQAEPRQQLPVHLHPQHRLLMAVPLDDRPGRRTIEGRRRESSLAREEFGQRKRPLGEAQGRGIFRKK